MRAAWRLLTMAAAINLAGGVGAAAAQTVVVIHAAPGSTVEVALNAATVGSVAADATGLATLAVNLPAHGSKSETDVHLFVDVCEARTRVVLAEPGIQSPLPDGCARKEIPGLYLLTGVTTFVVDVGRGEPTARLRQGPAPVRWLNPELEENRPTKPPVLAPRGFVVSGGAGFVTLAHAVDDACGSVADCSGGGLQGTLTAGATVWITRFLGAEVAYVKPMSVDTKGVGLGYNFTSALHTEVVNFSGKVGAAIGRVRLYAKGGASYHRATFETTTTVDDYTITVDETDVTVPGGTQSFGYQTSGWGWLGGAGLEVWLRPSFGLYTEGGVAFLKGKATDASEGLMKDRMTSIVVGLRVRIGR